MPFYIRDKAMGKATRQIQQIRLFIIQRGSNSRTYQIAVWQRLGIALFKQHLQHNHLQ